MFAGPTSKIRQVDGPQLGLTVEVEEAATAIHRLKEGRTISLLLILIINPVALCSYKLFMRPTSLWRSGKEVDIARSSSHSADPCPF